MHLLSSALDYFRELTWCFLSAAPEDIGLAGHLQVRAAFQDVHTLCDKCCELRRIRLPVDVLFGDFFLEVRPVWQRRVGLFPIVRVVDLALLVQLANESEPSVIRYRSLQYLLAACLVMIQRAVPHIVVRGGV